MSILNDTLVNGKITQSEAASNPNDLVRLAEAQAMLAALFQGAWNGITTYTAGQMTTDSGSLWSANVQTLNQQPSLNSSVWKQMLTGGAAGQSAFIYVGYASDTSGTGFSLTPGSGLNYIAFTASATAIVSPTAANFSNWRQYVGATGATGSNGASSFTYLGFASDASGTGFSLTPGSGLNYIAFLTTTSPVVSLTAANFAGLWSQYINAGTNGNDGAAGASSFTYVGYASDTSGTGFSLTPGSGLNFIAFLVSPTVISSPAAPNFSGLWRQYVGATGATGSTGATGTAGASAYGYIGYASDASGTAFSLTPSSGLNFVAFLISPTVIASPVAANFAGLWKNYANNFTVSGPLTLGGGVLAINASSANTASYVVSRDGSGNFAANAITVNSLVVGSGTLSFSGGAFNFNAGLVTSGLTVTGLSGILMAASGVISGSATTDNLSEGTTSKYFTTARVLATALTGITSTKVLLATDTILSAMAKIDNIIGGSFPAGSISGNLSITGTLTVTGATTLATSLTGILMASSGTISGGATTDNLTVGSTNLYWTQGLFNTAIAAIKGANNGVAPLDSSGKVPLANSYATGATPYGAASQSAMLALSAAKQGDFAMRSDTNIAYVLSNNTPSILSNWTAFVYPVMSVNGATGTVVLTTDNVTTGSTNLYWTQTLFNTAITAIKGAASGVCPLDTNSLVPAANLPPIGNGIWTANSQSVQTGLTSALKGDLANRTDQNLTYILSNNTPATFSSWVPLLYPVASVNGATGTVTLTSANISENTNLYFTNARVLTAPLTGFTAGAGTVTAADTVLSAFQKVVANSTGFVPLTGAVTISGVITHSSTLVFSGTTNPGLIVNNLSATQIGSLATTSGNYGNIVYDTTNGQLKALIAGSFVVLSGGASVLLAGGSGSTMSGALFFQDGLAKFLQFGNQFNCRVSNSDGNLDFVSGTTVVLTCDTSNNVTAPNGFFNTGSGGGYKLNGNNFCYIESSRNAIDFGGNFKLTTTTSFATLAMGYNGSIALAIDQSNDTILQTGVLKMSANKVIDQGNLYYDQSGNQILGARQSHISDAGGVSGSATSSGTGFANSTEFNTFITAVNALVTTVNNLKGGLQTHGLFA